MKPLKSLTFSKWVLQEMLMFLPPLRSEEENGNAERERVTGFSFWFEERESRVVRQWGFF